MTRHGLDLDAFREELVHLGFAPGPNGRTYVRTPYQVLVEDGWVVVRRSANVATGHAAADDAQPEPGLGAPGLWRTVRDEDGEARVFELSPRLFETGRDPSTLSARFEELLSWALGTSHGEVPAGWEAPSEKELSEWVPAERLTVHAGSELRQGRLVREADRLALRFPIVPAVSPDLPEARELWLRAVLADAQQRWRTIRIAPTPEAGVRAEIDLSGAPGETLETLCRTALDTLRWVVAWIVPAATFLADASVECRALEALSPQGGLARSQPGGAR